MPRIPLVDLQAQYASIKSEIDSTVAAVLREAVFIGGHYLKTFEREFAQYCGTRFAVGVSNGTDAIQLALLACGITPGDEVITVPNTFIATTEAIAMVGANVRFVDVDAKTGLMDPEGLERAVTNQTRAVIPVHLYGQPADMRPILDVARRNGLKVVGDAAQAHGAVYEGQAIGVLGDVVTFSFYPGKNLGAYGDAGAIVTNDEGIANRISILRDHGSSRKYEHEVEGFNCRLDALQAAILSVKLRHLEAWTEARRTHASLYRELLRDIPGLVLLDDRPGSRHVYHLFAVRTARRDALREHLESRGIVPGIHYPTPLHRQPAYAKLGLPEGSFPAAEALCREILSLPMFPELTSEQIRFVAAEVSAGLTNGGHAAIRDT